MRKLFTFLCAALMSVGMYAATVVTITESDFPASGTSFTKDGVTVSAGSIDVSEGNLEGGGSFSTTLGNFTKIEIYAEMSDVYGTGWSDGTWTGNASSVSFSGYISGYIMGGGEGVTLTFTIEEPAPDFAGEGTLANPYQITSAADWNTFATRVSEGNTYSGVYFQLTNDIAISTMVGTDADHAFNGSFDGAGHTITATLSSSDNNCAPFAYTYGATIKNLHTTGIINTSESNAGGVVGRNGTASLTLTNVSSDITINSTKSGNASHGGLVGYAINATISGCAFTGRLLGENSSRFGGLLGWKSNTPGSSVNINDCLFAPAEVTMSADNSKTFAVIGGATVNCTNCYYTQAFGTDQGKLMRAITAGEGVLVLNTGSATIYNVSGITSYGTGISYDNVLYGGNGDEISLNLSGSDNGYEASTGTLSGTENPYTLTMADADCQINKLAPAPAEVTVVFAANSKTVERTVTLPHEFVCSYYSGHGELDAIIQELYGISDGHCSDYNYPVASGNEAVSAGSYGDDNYITISAAFEGTATVSGWYWNWDAYDGDGAWMDYSLTISIKGDEPEPTGGLNIVELTPIPASWADDQSIYLTPEDLPGFKEVTLEEAMTWTTEYTDDAILFYGFSDVGRAEYVNYYNGTKYHGSSYYYRYTVSWNARVYYTTGGSTPEPQPAEEVNITPNVDPENPTVYYSTFFDSANKYALPAGVEAYIVTTVSGDAMQLQKVADAGQTIPAGAGVILKASVTPFTLTVSDADAVSVEGNRLEGSDISIATPANCYVLAGNEGVGFYHYTASMLNPHKAYIIYAPNSGNQAPRRLRFAFDQATGVENVQGDNVQNTKVIENGVLYIIKNGAKYNAMGQEVK